MFVVKAINNSWEIRFPYYFMIDIVTEFTANNGMPTQIFSIATGAAKDNIKTGRSQSTLMFVLSPLNDIEAFKTFWLTQLGIDEDDNDKGAFLVAYMGMDGAYQTNRQHFLDFMSQINIPSINDNENNN